MAVLAACHSSRSVGSCLCFYAGTLGLLVQNGVVIPGITHAHPTFPLVDRQRSVMGGTSYFQIRINVRESNHVLGVYFVEVIVACVNTPKHVLEMAPFILFFFLKQGLKEQPNRDH